MRRTGAFGLPRFRSRASAPRSEPAAAAPPPPGAVATPRAESGDGPGGAESMQSTGRNDGTATRCSRGAAGPPALGRLRPARPDRRRGRGRALLRAGAGAGGPGRRVRSDGREAQAFRQRGSPRTDRAGADRSSDRIRQSRWKGDGPVGGRGSRRAGVAAVQERWLDRRERRARQGRSGRVRAPGASGRVGGQKGRGPGPDGTGPRGVGGASVLAREFRRGAVRLDPPRSVHREGASGARARPSLPSSTSPARASPCPTKRG